MSEPALKLTTYFGERSRVGGRLLAEELLDIHARHGIRASILLRGIQGFGAKHRRRTDRLLTLSEDLPLVSVALDTSERIEALLGDVGAIEHEGLVTLERAILCGALPEPRDLAREPDEAVKLTVYVGRHERAGGSPAFVTVCKALHDAGVAGATVLLGVDGTRHGQRRRARFFAANASVPMMVMAVGDGKLMGDALARLDGLLREPMFTLERVRVCKRDGILLREPHGATPRDAPSVPGGQSWQKLTIVMSEAAIQEHRPAYVELVRSLRTAGAAGATSMRGIWGFHGDHAPHGDRLLSLRRHVPVVTVAVDAPERIATLFAIADELTQDHGLVTSEMVPRACAPHAGARTLARELPARDD